MRTVFRASKKLLTVIPIYGLALFCIGVSFIIVDLASGASKTKQPSAAGPNNPSARASMAEVKNVLKVRLAASVFVLQVLDRKAQRVQQTVPPASGMLDVFRSWLALKTTRNAYAGGLYPKLERAYSSLNTRGDGTALQESLRGNPSGASVRTVLAQQTGQSLALLSVKSAHDDTLKYRKTAEEKLRSASEELWRRGEKGQSGELDRFRGEMASDMADAARWLEEGLKAHALALEGYYAAELREPVGGLGKAVLAAAEDCPLKLIEMHERTAKEAKERQDSAKARQAVGRARCSGPNPPTADTCKQLIDGENYWIQLEQDNIDYYGGKAEELRKQCAPKPQPPPKPPDDCPKATTQGSGFALANAEPCPPPPKPAVPKPLTPEAKQQIFDFVSKNEGGQRKTAYILDPKKFPKSGITVGSGVDLSWQGDKKLAITPKLSEKLKPYMDKTLRGAKARAYLKKNPLTLNQTEVDELDKAVLGNSLS
ncbi:MAG: pesticin C-terminus-like muramidase, partial [Elusimicrobiota bacterium]